MSGWGRSRQCADLLSQALALAARRASNSAALTTAPTSSLWGAAHGSSALSQAGGAAEHAAAVRPVLWHSRGFSNSAAALAEALTSQEVTAEEELDQDEFEGVTAEVRRVAISSTRHGA